MQLITTLTVSVLGLVLLASATPPTLSSQSVTPLVTDEPNTCPLPPVCEARSPRVCGRTAEGMCRRFSNICDLLDARVWIHAPRGDCSSVREIGAQHAYWCHQPCPAEPVVCPRVPAGQEICIRSRNHQLCKVVTNRCQLLNNNCFGTPRHNWRQTDIRACYAMQLGDKPHACRRMYTRRPRPRPRPKRTTTRSTATVTPRPTPRPTTVPPSTTAAPRTTAAPSTAPPTAPPASTAATRVGITEPPKDHDSTTTARPTTART